MTCHGGKGGPKQSFIGYMVYNRFWWHHDIFAATIGGGQMNNAGRYLTLVPPINGADAVSGTPYFPAFPGAQRKPGMARRRSIGCPHSSLLSGWKWALATLMCRIGRVEAASRLLAAITALPPVSSAATVLPQGRVILLARTPPAAVRAVSGSRIYARAKRS